NPVTGAVTPGGTISLGNTDLVIQGSLVRNNGTITSNNGNIVVDFGGVLRGSGTNDVNQIVLRNGGQFLAGNSPGLAAVRNLDLKNGGVVGAEMSRAAGVGGSGDVAGSSGWGVIEYGATATGPGRLTITGTPAAKALFRMGTVTDVAP